MFRKMLTIIFSIVDSLRTNAFKCFTALAISMPSIVNFIYLVVKPGLLSKTLK